MDDYLAQTDRTLRAMTSLEQSKASSASFNYAQSEGARAAAADIRSRQAERQAAAVRQQAEHAHRLQSESARQMETALREQLAGAHSELCRAMSRIRALEAQLAQVADEAQAKIQSVKRARKDVFKALDQGDLDALAQLSPALAATWEQQTTPLKEQLALRTQRTREYAGVMNGLMRWIHCEVLRAMDVDLSRYETLRMHQVYEVLHRRHPDYDLQNSLQGYVLAFQYRTDWDALYQGGWTAAGELPPRDVPIYAQTLEPLPPRMGAV